MVFLTSKEACALLGLKDHACASKLNREHIKKHIPVVSSKGRPEWATDNYYSLEDVITYLTKQEQKAAQQQARFKDLLEKALAARPV
jgi:hypothetical protein